MVLPAPKSPSRHKLKGKVIFYANSLAIYMVAVRSWAIISIKITPHYIRKIYIFLEESCIISWYSIMPSIAKKSCFYKKESEKKVEK